MLDKIINSKARLAILSLLFNAKDKQFYAQEIINYTKLDPANIHKELDNLISAGILKTEDKDNRKFYALNKENDFYEVLSKLFEKYLEKQNMERWFIQEEVLRNNPSLGITYINYDFNKEYFKKAFGLSSVCQGLVIFKGGNLDLCFIKKETHAMAQEVLRKIIDNPEWGFELNDKVKTRAHQWADAGRKIYLSNLMQFSNEALCDLFLEFYSAQQLSHASGWPSNTVDFENSMFSKYLIKLLEEKKKKFNLQASIGEVFSILTTPLEESFAQKEYKDLNKLLENIYRDEGLTKTFSTKESRFIEEDLKGKYGEFFSAIDKHRVDFGWLAYQFEGPGWGNNYFIDILASLVRQNIQPADLLEETREKEKKIKRLQEKYREIFELSKYEADLFEVAKGFLFMKGYRKDLMFYSLSCQEYLFKEIGRRFYLSVRQVRYMYPEEIKVLLLKGEVDPNELNKMN